VVQLILNKLLCAMRKVRRGYSSEAYKLPRNKKGPSLGCTCMILL